MTWWMIDTLRAVALFLTGAFLAGFPMWQYARERDAAATRYLDLWMDTQEHLLAALAARTAEKESSDG